ncbi:hypothetical protein [Bacillus sp. JJ1764]|uniref:hypothetical protein n=1 Tax=Bacillus sp. JJ1764 TaxID=3122964 RepID=UPI002FFF291F
MKFTSLAHLFNERSLTHCLYEQPYRMTTGVNGTTKEQFSDSLEENITDLIIDLKVKAIACSRKTNVYPKAQLRKEKEKTVGNTGT